MTKALSAPQERIWKLLNHLKNGTTEEFDQVVAVRPGEFTDPAIAARERELVFGRVPSIVCHGSEIARPGDFLTVQMPRNKIIVVRQSDGSVKSFVNHCRHRGALLENQERGSCRLFSCGYHRGLTIRTARYVRSRVTIHSATWTAPSTASSSCQPRSDTGWYGWSTRPPRRSTLPPGWVKPSTRCWRATG